jgi:hypothetical protein
MTTTAPGASSSEFRRLVLDQENMVQEAVFELFTAGTVCMAGSAGLIDDDVAADFIEEKLSETIEYEHPEDDPDYEPAAPKEHLLRSIFDEKPRARRPGDLFIWARRGQASFQLLSHYFQASHGEPREPWIARRVSR